MRISDWSSDVCSSDLVWSAGCQSCVTIRCANLPASRFITGTTASPSGTASAPPGQKSFCTSTTISISARRSEEHTSELQSLMSISYAVFCLKKKNTKQRAYSTSKALYLTNYTYTHKTIHQ